MPERRNKKRNKEIPEGLAPRVAVSIAVFFSWLVYTIIHLAFFSSSYTLLQNLAIIFSIFLVGVAILAVMWSSWGMKMKSQWKRKGN